MALLKTTLMTLIDTQQAFGFNASIPTYIFYSLAYFEIISAVLVPWKCAMRILGLAKISSIKEEVAFFLFF